MYPFMGQYVKVAPVEDSPLKGTEVWVLTEGILDDGRVLGVYSTVIRAKAAVGGFKWIECDEDTWLCPGQGEWTLQVTRCQIDSPNRSRPQVYRPSTPVFTSALTRDPDSLVGGPSAEARDEAEAVVDRAFGEPNKTQTALH